MIKVKAIISGWKEVDRKTAERFARNLMSNITTMPDERDRARYINEERLQGITVEELLSMEVVE